MEIQGTMCRLCLRTCESCKAIEENVKDVLGNFLPKINLAATQEPVICTNCERILMKCFDFKTKCLNTHTYMDTFGNTKDDVKLDLKDVYLIKNKGNAGVPEDRDVCGFCIDSIKSCSAISLYDDRGDVTLEQMIEQCLPELDLGIIKKPVICRACHGSLEKCFHFMTNCLIVEEKVRKCSETQYLNSESKIEPSHSLQFAMKNVTSEVDGNLVDKIKVELENADEKGFGDGHDTFKLEQMFCDDSDNTKESVEHERKSIVNLDVLKFESEEQLTPKNMLVYKEDINLDVIKVEAVFSLENNIKEENLSEAEDQKYLLNEEIEIKTEDFDFNRFEDGMVLPQPEVATRIRRRQTLTNRKSSEITMYQCECCSFQTNLKGNLKAHLVQHKDASEVTMHKCDYCSFRTKYKYGLRKHLLVHKNSSELTIYRCDLCSYFTKRKYNLKSHSLVHKSSAEVTMHQCDSCSFQTKHKNCLKSHSLIHKNSSEVTMYKCDSCSYQTKHKSHLISHLLVHKHSEVTMRRSDPRSFHTKHKNVTEQYLLLRKDPSEIRIYQCASCTFQTKHRNCLRKHLLKHKDPSQITMYKCDYCSYKTKRKRYLKVHVLRHSQVQKYQCDCCSFQTKYEYSLKTHLLKHKESSEETVYKCVSCSFRSKHKHNLKSHSLIHANTYKCHLCMFETKRKGILKNHIPLHSQANTYVCDLCSFLTKYKSSFNKHLLKHMDPSEVTMYKCDFCHYQVLYKDQFNRHLLKHKDPSEVTMYKCYSCSHQTKRKHHLISHILLMHSQVKDPLK